MPWVKIYSFSFLNAHFLGKNRLKISQKPCCICLDTLVSGSPILQDGKLVGALTHVLVNDSLTGYGIYAENMLEVSESVAEENLKKAS